MVHKKSEYKMQFNNLTKELRKQIWQDNINFRCNRRSSNQAHHYWEFQVTDDKCDCDVADDEDVQQKPAQLRVKHQSLLEKHEKQNGSNNDDGSKNSKLHIEEEKSREIGSQTPEWRNEVLDSRLDKSSEKLLRNFSSPSLQVTKDSLSRPPSPVPSRSPLQRPRTAMSSSIKPSRTTQKMHCEGKKTHFVPYGWNEEHTDVGKKKTYNICAPETQVHEVAILASKRRNASVEKFLVEEMEGRKHFSKKNTDVTANHSSIWMSEYQEQYSRRVSLPQNKTNQRNARPSSAPPVTRRTPSWRYS